MLFDIIAKLNSEIVELMKERHPDIDHIPMLVGSTDGSTVTIHFADKMVWDSNSWQFHEKHSEELSLTLIENHLRARITDYMGQMRRFGW